MHKIEMVKTSQIRFYHEKLFSLYDTDSDRYKRLDESILERGILSPLIVQQIDFAGNFEVLSGNNRLNVARKNDLSAVPCIVVQTESDEEARLIVIESNWQRSVSEMTVSHRAKVFAAWYEAIKRQGKRTDLLTELEALEEESKRAVESEDYLKKISGIMPFKAPSDAENLTSGHNDQTLTFISRKTGFSSSEIQRYVRVAKLPDFLLDYVDNDRIALMAAVELSYLRPDVWTYLNSLLVADPKLKISVKTAAKLRQLDSIDKIESLAQLQDAVNGSKAAKVGSISTVSLPGKFLSQFFNKTETKKNISSAIEKSLRLRTQTIPDILRRHGAMPVGDDKLDELIVEAVEAYFVKNEEYTGSEE